MTAAPRTLLSELQKGHEFPSTPFAVTAEYVESYLRATRDENGVYGETKLAPPLAVAARALGALLELVELPGGSLHTGQEMEVLRGVPQDATLELCGSVAQRSERAEMVIAALEFEVRDAGEAVLRGRTTVMMPQDGAA